MARTISFFIIGILIMESRICSTLGIPDDAKSLKPALFDDPIAVNYTANGFRSFQAVIDHLDQLKELRVDAIWLSSIFPPSRNLSIADHIDVHPGLGKMADFERLLKAARNLGIKVYLTVMPYATSDQHPWFKKWLQNESPYNNFYVTLEEKPPRDANGWSDERRIGYLQKFEHTPCLDLSNADVRHRLNKELFGFWLNKGVDGFIIEGLWQYVPYSKGLFPYNESIVENNKGYLHKIRKFIDSWTKEHNATFKYLGVRTAEAKDTWAAHYRTKGSPDETAKLTTMFLDLKEQPDVDPASDKNDAIKVLNVTRRDLGTSSPDASIGLRSLRVKRGCAADKDEDSCKEQNFIQKSWARVKHTFSQLCNCTKNAFKDPAKTSQNATTVITM